MKTTSRLLLLIFSLYFLVWYGYPAKHKKEVRNFITAWNDSGDRPYQIHYKELSVKRSWLCSSTVCIHNMKLVIRDNPDFLVPEKDIELTKNLNDTTDLFCSNLSDNKN